MLCEYRTSHRDMLCEYRTSHRERVGRSAAALSFPSSVPHTPCSQRTIRYVSPGNAKADRTIRYVSTGHHIGGS
eukprot:2419335-Rhodomonas_salina.1